jgi:TPR repeat protein
MAGRDLAEVYHLGLDVAKDETKARAYLERAGDVDGAASAKGVADLYLKGEVIGADFLAAVRWLKKAADAGDGAATGQLSPRGLNPK